MLLLPNKQFAKSLWAKFATRKLKRAEKIDTRNMQNGWAFNLSVFLSSRDNRDRLDIQ